MMEQDIQENWYTQSKICENFKTTPKTFSKWNCRPVYVYRNRHYYDLAEVFWAAAAYKIRQECIRDLTGRIKKEREELRELYGSRISDNRQARNDQARKSMNLDHPGTVPEEAYASVVEQCLEAFSRISDTVWAGIKNPNLAEQNAEAIERELIQLEDILNHPVPDWSE